ncbi:MAG: hypothetical protein E7055_17800 [Lentisphaerae bacterium]|nr:hypothetical protein [Lentisphaerota bacterium]
MDETAQKMNDALKKAGFNRRQATVRHRRALYDDDYRIKVRDPKVSLLQIEEIVGEFESIRYDEYSGEILEGCNNYVSVSRDEEHPVDITQILPLVEPALTKAMQDGRNQVVQLPTRRYLIGQAQRGNPDLWGMKPDYMNRLTGKPNDPEQEFNYITAFYWSGENTPEAIRSTATVIAKTIAENELDLEYVTKAS